MAITLTDVQQKLAYLTGDGTPPSEATTEYTQRTSFIQSTLEEIYRLHPFELNRVTATIAIVNGIASLPSAVDPQGDIDVRYTQSGTGNDHVFTQLPYSESDDYGQGDYRYWFTGSQGALLLNTKETDQILSIRYPTTAPIINASISSPFPDAHIVALGALRWVRMSQNPFADISQEKDTFQEAITDFIAQYNRNVPRRLYTTVQERESWHTGQI